MCGRFAFATPIAVFADAFPDFTVPEDFGPRYNIAPTQPIPVVPNDGTKTVQLFHWGLVPHWAKDPAIGNRMINARAETLAEKPSFKRAFAERRCLILVDGFYEWRKDAGARTKTPIHIKLKTGKPFAFAGLWETWHDANGDPLRSCTIVTTTPNELIGRFHHRMPVILPLEAYDAWLDPEPADPEALKPLLIPYPTGEMVAYPVSTGVNRAANDSPDCIVQVGPAVEQPSLLD